MKVKLVFNGEHEMDFEGFDYLPRKDDLISYLEQEYLVDFVDFDMDNKCIYIFVELQ